MSLKTAWFFLKLYIKLFHSLETFYLSSFFLSVSLKTFVSSYLKWHRQPMKWRAWLAPVSFKYARWPILYIVFFETNVGLKHLRRSVKTFKKSLNKFFFWGITLRRFEAVWGFFCDGRVSFEVVEWNQILYCWSYLMSNGFMLKRALNALFVPMWNNLWIKWGV